MKGLIRKTISYSLTFLLVLGIIPWSGLSPVALAADSAMISAITAEAQAKATAIRAAVDGAMPVTPGQISSAISAIKQEIDNEAHATIGALEATHDELVSKLAAWEQIAASGSFMAEIEQPDPNAIPIYTAEDLVNIAHDMNGSYVLMNHIDLSQYNGGIWMPLDGTHEHQGQNYDIPFGGMLDGKGYAIKNMNITGETVTNGSAWSLGLFPRMNGATVKNLGFENASVELKIPSQATTVDKNLSIGVLCGEMYRSTIANCYVRGSAAFINEAETFYYTVMLGGLCGDGTESELIDCFSAASVTGNAAQSINAGGLIGILSSLETGVDTKLARCYNLGNVSISGVQDNSYSAYAGGIAGQVRNYPSSLSDFYNAGDIRIDFGMSGGVAGIITGADGNQSLSGCINTGRIASLSTFATTGGIVGETQYDISSCYNTGFVGYDGEIVFDGTYYSTDTTVGGIAGICGSVGNCYNTGAIRGTGCAGGISAQIGAFKDTPVTVYNCGNSGSVSGKQYAGGIAGQMAYTVLSDNSSSFNLTSCHNRGTVRAVGYAGGVLGEIIGEGIRMNMSHCFNDADVASDTAAAGIAAVWGDLNYEATYCRNTGAISASGTSGSPFYPGAGGIFAYSGMSYGAEDDSKILLCYNSGMVTSAAFTGGIVGSAADRNEWVGSDLITIRYTNIERCVNSGKLSGVNVSGISNGGMTAGCYNDAHIVGDPAMTIKIAGIGGSFAQASVNTGNITLEPNELLAGATVSGITFGSANGCFNSGNITITDPRKKGEEYFYTDYPTLAAGISATGQVITNCRNTGTITGANYAGGIAAETDAGRIEGCHNTGKVTAIGFSGWLPVYGKAGGIATAAYSVTNCLNEGAVSADYAQYVGGIAAETRWSYRKTDVTMTGCVNLGSVSAQFFNTQQPQFGTFGLGGITGYAPTGRISGCYNLGTLHGDSPVTDSYGSLYNTAVGGIAGVAWGYHEAGENLPITISDCANAVPVGNPAGVAGGMIGMTSGHFILDVDSIGVGNPFDAHTAVLVSGCRNAGDVSSPCSVGGIIGEINGHNSANLYTSMVDISHIFNVTIENSQNIGHVSQTDDREQYFAAGGIVGSIHDGNNRMDDHEYTLDPDSRPDDYYANRCSVRVSLSGCTNFGSVDANIQAGGITGAISSTTHLKGDHDSLTITNCQNDGDISVRGDLETYSNGYTYAGGIVGRAAALISGSNSAYNAPNTITLSSCTNNGIITANTQYHMTTTVDNKALAGGMMAYAPRYHTTISRCANSGTIFGHAAGGILASDNVYINYLPFAHTFNHRISQNSNSGSISGTNAGGIVGEIKYDLYISFDLGQCVNYGVVSVVLPEPFVTGGAAGGIVGSYQGNWNRGDTYDRVISDCYNVGDIAAAALGTIPEDEYPSLTPAYAGGIAGYINNIALRNCYNAGTLVYADTASMVSVYAGGIAGASSNSLIDGCAVVAAEIHANWPASYWADEYTRPHTFVVASGMFDGGNIRRGDGIMGSPDQTGSVPLEVSSFLNPATYSDRDWDFSSVWAMPGTGLPVLRWQGLSQGPPIPSWALKILAVNKPSRGYAANLSVYGSVPFETTSQIIEVGVSYGASWDLYGDPDCNSSSLISDKTMKNLQIGENNAYIRVTADDQTPVVYKVVLTREAFVDPNAIGRTPITFHAGLADSGKKDVSMEIDWGWDLFNKGSFEYDNRIAIPALTLSGAVEISEYQAEMVLKQLKIGNISHYDYNNSPYAAHTIASTKLTFEDTEYTLITVIARGTTGFMDGVIDVNPWGFDSSATVVKQNIESYADQYGIDLADDNIKFWLTGHSLGGAVVNLLSLKLTEAGYGSIPSTFVYTFASPLTYHSKFQKRGIFNVVNKDDGVPHASTALASYRVGEDIKWKRNSAIDQRFYQLTSGKSLAEIMDRNTLLIWEYPGQEIEKFLASHDTTTYMAYLLSRGDAGEFYQYKIRLASFKCPVDIYVYNSKGHLVGKVIDNVPTFVDVFIWLNGDEKYVYMPFDDTYTFVIFGTDDGTMNYSVYEVDSATGEISEQKEFANVSLYDGKQMQSEMNEDELISHTRLYALDAEGNTTAEIQTDGTQTPIQSSADYGISLGTSDYDFTAADHGYPPVTAYSVAVDNTGNRATGALAVALSGTDTGSFELSTTTLDSIAVGDSSSFTVKPKDGLGAGTYAATVTVSGSNDISRSFHVRFIVNEVGTPAGSASITGTNAIGQVLTVMADPAVEGAGTPGYQWQADGINVGTGDTYEIQGADAGKAITCIVTYSGSSGSITALFDDGKTVPYNITANSNGQAAGDTDVSLSPSMGRPGDEIELCYVLGDGGGMATNTLTFTGASGLANLTTAGENEAQNYIVNAGDAINGVITITATFLHTDLLPQVLTFAESSKTVTFSEDGTFTNPAVGEGEGTITYQSNNEAVATVDSETGQVSVIGAGSSVITAAIEADDTYDSTTASYMLTVRNASQSTPEGLGRTAETAANANDGTITGVTTSMEYRKQADALYTPISGTNITGLAPGTYLVRYAAKPNYDASDDTRIVISAYSKPSEPTTPPSGGGGSGSGNSGVSTTYYTVSFNTNGGNTIQSQSIAGNGKAAKPADPIKEGFTFAGWFADSALTKEYSFSATVTGNLTLYAKWDESQAVSQGGLNNPGATSGGKWGNPFVDVSQSSWYYEPVEYVCTHGVMNGTSTNPMLFSPEAQLTRGMIVTILYRHAGLPEASMLRNPFTDVTEDSWYDDAVKWAFENSIVSGINHERYSPDAPITRQDLAVILSRYADFTGAELSETRETPLFTDGGNIADYAKDAVENLFRAGIISGKPGNIFDPIALATRAETAAMLQRFLTGMEQ